MQSKHNRKKDRRLMPAILVIIMLILLLLVLRVEALVQTDIVYSMHDTYVNSTNTSQNYDRVTLTSGRDVSDLFEIWYRFNLSDPTGYYVTSAVLWTYVNSARNNRDYNIHMGDSASWTETDLTWSTKPGYGAIIDTNTISAGGWNTWTITAGYGDAYDTGDQFVSYSIENGAEGDIIVEDTENTLGTGNVPYLNLTMMIPEVNLLLPDDGTKTHETSITFQYETADAGNITNCSIIFDSSVNKTNTSLVGNETSSFIINGIEPGDHTWAIRCYDSNREDYEINPETRDITVLAFSEWYSPSSATPLDIGTALINEAAPTGTRLVRANNSNTNVAVSCASGDCDVVGHNWTTTGMGSTQTIGSQFNCTTTVAGSYQAVYNLVSDQNATPDTLTVNCTILAPDLRIDSVNITFSDNTPVEGDTVTITAGIYNDGSYPVTNAVVRFYDGHYDTGDQIGTDSLVNISVSGTETVQQSWTADIGEHDIYVVLDPDIATNGSIDESDETNNFAYNEVDIGLWTVFVGNVTGQLVLDTAENRSVMRWNVTDTTNSIIYVTDTDSSPTFASLVALGKTSLGGAASDDFLEFDAAINTTSFPDSVNLTFTSSGHPLQTQTFTTFGNQVTEVPIVNSTNTTSFVTGILWDSADDAGNNEYDNTTKEDILFVSRVNVTKTGLYGVYDYEIKIPARLRRYKGADSTSVTFYTEIK